MNISEQKINILVKKDGTISINEYVYQLNIDMGLGFTKVNVKEIKPVQNGWEIKASLGFLSKTDSVPTDTVNHVMKNLGKDEIFLGGEKPKKLTKIDTKNMKESRNITQTQMNHLVRKILNESHQEIENYMLFSNLQQIMRQAKMILEMDPEMIDKIIQKGHDWADDHISEAKVNMDQVFDFFMNEKRKINQYIEFQDLQEAKKRKNKLCARGKAAAQAKFKVYPSAYANGYAVQVCKGKMPGTDGKKRCSGSYCK